MDDSVSCQVDAAPGTIAGWTTTDLATADTDIRPKSSATLSGSIIGSA